MYWLHVLVKVTRMDSAVVMILVMRRARTIRRRRGMTRIMRIGDDCSGKI